MADAGPTSTARRHHAAALSQPVARAVANVGAGPDAADHAARRNPDGPVVLHRVRPAVRAGDPGRRRLAEAADVRLAHQPVVAVPAHAGLARRAGAGADPGGAGQAVVGDSAAVRLAAVPFVRASAGTAFNADAGRRHPVRDWIGIA